MVENTLADRLNKIISESQINKTDFAKSVGISRAYVYNLTSGRLASCSRSLALLIEKEYGYPSEWILTGKVAADNLSKELADKMKGLNEADLRSVAAYLDTLKKGGGNE